MHLKSWIKAFRLRTLPLALSCVSMGAFLATEYNAFRWDIFILCLFTTVFLQILSNLANDYGDSVHGADHTGRSGPARMVQSGEITLPQMKRMVIVFAMLSFISGLALLYVSFGKALWHWLIFLVLGLLSIAAAITYTMGRKPYGYAGLGDVAVLIFFGLVGVMGSSYLYIQSFNPNLVWPALSCGLLAVGVLNINNIRDRQSDAQAGKKSIPVRFGRSAGLYYHVLIISGAIICAMIYVLNNYHNAWQWLFLLTLPLLIWNILAVFTKPESALDPWLRQLALTALLFVLFFGLGIIL